MDRSVCFFAGKGDLALLFAFMQKWGLECLYLRKESFALGEMKFIAQKMDLSKDLPAWRFSALIMKSNWALYKKLNGWIYPSKSEIMELTLMQQSSLEVCDCRLYAIMDYLADGEILPKSEDFQKTCDALMEFIRNNTVPLKNLRLMSQAHQIFLQNPGKIQLCQSYFERES